jgi:phosphoribosylamine--glycine ligase
MLTANGPRVLEFNCRFGDPETQAILARVDGDFLGALHAAASGDLGRVSLPFAEVAAVTVVLAAGSYPERGDSGTPIEGLDAPDALVFQAGTAVHGGRLVTNGGRILDVTATGPSVADARERAYAAVERISFAGMRFRSDIAAGVEAVSA